MSSLENITVLSLERTFFIFSCRKGMRGFCNVLRENLVYPLHVRMELDPCCFQYEPLPVPGFLAQDVVE
jgi:hypothetical protein